MSRRLFSNFAWTPTSTADTATTLTNGTYMVLGANSATQQLFVTEIFIQGTGTSSTNINSNVFARDHVLAGTPTTLAAPATDGPMPGVATAPATLAVSCTAATTPPQRSILTTSARLSLAVNALGGIARWKPADLSEAWWINGQTVDVSESSLSGTNAGSTTASTQNTTIMYEVL